MDIAAFIGLAERGPVDRAVVLGSFEEYLAWFGAAGGASGGSASGGGAEASSFEASTDGMPPSASGSPVPLWTQAATEIASKNRLNLRMRISFRNG